MAVATLAALVHDLLVVVGVYSLFQLPVTPATVIAILTILGFSIYDRSSCSTAPTRTPRLDQGPAHLHGHDNLSLNQVLMRSVNTILSAAADRLAAGHRLVLLGAATLQEFGLALFVGQLSGVLVDLHRRPSWRC